MPRKGSSSASAAAPSRGGCNGFHDAAVEAKYGGIGHMWGDLMARHDQIKFHLQVGGGDQIYCDDVWSLPAVLPWVAIDDAHARARQPFTAPMLEEVEQYYFGHYCRHFTEDPSFARGLASIPYVYTWDDHAT
ncbi:hypothetical protein MNEG_16238 [Monoraphidium neglectum]|uniref:PhoD-like phosphatase domain-containing protein n=1 Tax=Monoraphidium neglectum TaxID=145388 RepID=A0A0D2LP18_9CHLO|nr:hypothetical protein MNEG_16238 [Monoraphidium neglectum]KIY91726.1 hypothetical protein MNEG_16238 [Monoraphidium neglectum]|eukprot:XP_013890746.1 hypothetical protein MNEG_16238 [Monoraphidium neglectum]